MEVKNITVICLISVFVFTTTITTNTYAQSEAVTYRYLYLPADDERRDRLAALNVNALINSQLAATERYSICLSEGEHENAFSRCNGHDKVIYLTAIELASRPGFDHTAMRAELSHITYAYQWCIEEKQDLVACDPINKALNSIRLLV